MKKKESEMNRIQAFTVRKRRGGPALAMGVCLLLAGCNPEDIPLVGSRKAPAARPAGAAAACTQASSPWKVLPIYGGGYVQNVVIAPSNPDVWYCYVDVGGPYRSDDRGMSWRPLHQNYLPSQTARSAACTRSLSVDPRDADNFVLVSGNQYDRPAGAFVSRDGGRTFRQTLFGRFYGNGPNRPSGLCLARNPSNPDELIAGEDMDGLFLSEDNGETWRLTGPKGHWFTDIKYDQAVPGRVYACASAPLKRVMASARCQRAFKLDRGRKTGFYVSADGGRVWTRLSDDAPAELVQVKGNGDLVGVFSDYREIRISHDGGRTWSDYHQGLPKKADTYFADAKPIPYEYYAFAAGDGFYLVADAAGTLYRRGTADAQWTKVERGAVEWGDPECENTPGLERKRLRKVFECACSIIIDPADPKRWMITDWYHIWQSPNEGRDWTARTRGMMQLVSFDLAFDPFNADNIIYGVADMGMFGTWNGGRTWESPKSHPYVQRLAFSKKTPGVLYAVGTRGQTFLFRSDDSGRTWTSLAGKPGLPQPMKEPGPCAFGVEVDPVNDDVYVTVSGPCAPGKGGVYRSHDRGETWEWFSKGLPVDKGLFRDGEWSGDLAWPMVFSPDGSCVLTLPKLREVWYLDRAAGIWRNSGDKSWNNRVVADPFRPGRFIKTGTVMRESTDGGRTWRDNESMPGSCWGLAFDAHVPGLLVLRGEDEMFISEDGGACFYALPQGLAYPHSGQTHVFVDRGRLFAFTGGSGVFTRTLHLKPARHNNQNQGNTQK